MRIDIRGSGFPLAAALVDHTERRLRFALTRSCDRIVRVAVLVGASSGPRGGEDKFCRMRILFKDAPPVLIDDAGADLYAVIDRAAERAGRNVAKRVDPLREGVRQAGLRLLRAPPGDAVGSDATAPFHDLVKARR
jgi:putative sigma-54 modulation protein